MRGFSKVSAFGAQLFAGSPIPAPYHSLGNGKDIYDHNSVSKLFGISQDTEARSLLMRGFS